jgi:hypothetical protein
MWLVRFCRVHTCRISCAWPERAVILDHAFDHGIVGVVGKGGVDEVSESDNGLFADEWQIAEFVLASGNLMCPAAMKHRAGSCMCLRKKNSRAASWVHMPDIRSKKIFYLNIESLPRGR